MLARVGPNARQFERLVLFHQERQKAEWILDDESTVRLNVGRVLCTGRRAARDLPRKCFRANQFVDVTMGASGSCKVDRLAPLMTTVCLVRYSRKGEKAGGCGKGREGGLRCAEPRKTRLAPTRPPLCLTQPSDSVDLCRSTGRVRLPKIPIRKFGVGCPKTLAPPCPSRAAIQRSSCRTHVCELSRSRETSPARA